MSDSLENNCVECTYANTQISMFARRTEVFPSTSCLSFSFFLCMDTGQSSLLTGEREEARVGQEPNHTTARKPGPPINYPCTVKNVNDFPVPRRDVTRHPPLGTGKSVTFFFTLCCLCLTERSFCSTWCLLECHLYWGVNTE
jgi:hypothetical protein